MIALLRPWWLIESGARVLVRILWTLHLRPRVGNNTLFLRGPLRLAWPSRDALFRAHSWLAGFALGMAIAETAQSSLTRWLFGSRFEGAAVLLGPLLGVLAGAFVAAGTLLPDDVAGKFSTEFFEAMAARGATVEQAMLSARSVTLRSHPKVNTWAAYQAYGDPDYRFPLPGA